MQYRVTWEIDIEADTPALAAMEARAIQQRPDNSATCFTVIAPGGGRSEIDLEPENEDTRL